MPFGYAALYYNNQPDQPSTRPPTLPLFLERADEHKDEVECVVGPTHSAVGPAQKHLVGPKREKEYSTPVVGPTAEVFVLVVPSTRRSKPRRDSLNAKLPRPQMFGGRTLSLHLYNPPWGITR